MGTEASDYLYALELQKLLNAQDSDGEHEIEELDLKMSQASKPKAFAQSRKRAIDETDFLNRTQNLVHPEWEILDPTPDVQSMFGAFDGKFFQGRLKCVSLEWSKRMYSCAGICYSRRNRLGMEVTIRLSEPLLKLRPRKDLVETMLHEMIHAYCFVLNIREGNGGHGPNFKKIMHAINKVAGTNITVYHTFYDEVEVYRQHIWRCNGACQNRAPFFGYVKRTSNRAPGYNDQWWQAHQEACGGTFMKIKGPDPPKKRNKSLKTKNKEITSAGDLRRYFTPKDTDNTKNNKNSIVGNQKGGLSSKSIIFSNMNGGRRGSSITAAFPPTSYPGLSSDPFNTQNFPNQSKPLQTTQTNAVGGILKNVVGFRDLNSNLAGNNFNNTAGNMTESLPGRGYLLNANSASISNNTTTTGLLDRTRLREIWSQRFSDGDNASSTPSDIICIDGNDNKNSETSRKNKRPTENTVQIGEPKRRRMSNDRSLRGSEEWIELDDDILLKESKDEVISISSNEESDIYSDGTAEDTAPRQKALKTLTADERQTVIKQEILEESTDLTDDDIVLIDDEYVENEADISVAAELADTSLIDEFFGEDTMLEEFIRENDMVPSGSHYKPNPEDDIISCPICQGKLKRCLIGEHLDGCTGIAIKIKPPLPKKKSFVPPKKVNRRPRSNKEAWHKWSSSQHDTSNVTLSNSEEEDFSTNSSPTLENSSPTQNVTSTPDNSSKLYRQRNLYKTTRQCPACGIEIEEHEMNNHLDVCLRK